MSSKSKNVQEPHGESHGVMLADDRSTAWAWLAGLIVAVFVALPLSASIAFATHPQTKQLFAGRLSEATTGGYQAFWWVVAILFAALPFIVGFGVAKLSGRALAVMAGIVALLVILAIVLGQIFVF
jgi:amino acid transporter